MRKIAVIGLGRFGMELARQLGASPAQVIAIDNSRPLIDEVKEHVDVAVRLDSTDEAALVAHDIGSVDVCVVAIGENFEAAMLTTVIVKKLGCPRVICRAQTAFHAEIFRRIGADEVIQPEAQAGETLARRLGSPDLEDFIPLAEGFTLIEMHVPAKFRGKALRDLQLRNRYGINLVAIKRPLPAGPDGAARQYTVISVPDPDDVIFPDDLLVVVGSNEALAKLPRE